MFESLKENLARKELITIVTLLRVLGTLSVVATISVFVRHGHGDEQPTFKLWWYPAFAALSFLTARGISQQRMWGKWLGYLQGASLLPGIPIGTIIGIALVLRVRRASKAGWFDATGPPA